MIPRSHTVELNHHVLQLVNGSPSALHPLSLAWLHTNQLSTCRLYLERPSCLQGSSRPEQSLQLPAVGQDSEVGVCLAMDKIPFGVAAGEPAGRENMKGQD